MSQYKTTGFHTPESNLTWIIDNEATVSIPMPEIPDNHDLSMYFETVPFLVEKKLKKQVVDIYANDIFVKKLTLDKSQIYNFTIPLPDDIKNQTEIIIKFKNTTAKSPKELKMSNDTRKYGIALTKLGIAVIDNNNPNRFNEYDIGDKISFDKNGNSTQYVGAGWSMPEKSFTWTDGSDAYINMFVKDGTDKKLQLNVFGRCIFDSESAQSQKITVYANNKELATWDCKREESVYRVVLPQDAIENSVLEVRFNIGNPFTFGADTRKLGIAVKEIEISNISVSKTKLKIALWLKKILKVPENPTTEEIK